jgi:hypothetical protein
MSIFSKIYTFINTEVISTKILITKNTIMSADEDQLCKLRNKKGKKTESFELGFLLATQILQYLDFQLLRQ